MTTEDSPRIRPVYLVLGVSDDGRDAAEAMLVELRAALACRPLLTDRIRVGIIEFGDRAAVRLPLTDVLDPDVRVPPAPEVGTGAAVGVALDLVGRTIEEDSTALAEDVTVERSLCWLVMDKAPTDDDGERDRAFDALTAYAGYPYVVPCGSAEVPEADLARLVHPSTGSNPMTTYLAAPPSGLRELGAVMAMTIVDTGLPFNLEAAGTGVELPLPDRLPHGVRSTADESIS